MNHEQKENYWKAHNNILREAKVLHDYLNDATIFDSKEFFFKLKSIVRDLNDHLEKVRETIEMVERNGWKIPADWQCPTCKTSNIENVSDGGTITCVQGHHSQ